MTEQSPPPEDAASFTAPVDDAGVDDTTVPRPGNEVAAVEPVDLMKELDAKLDSGDFKVRFRRPGSDAPEEVTVFDGANKVDRDEMYNKVRTPTAAVKKADGTIEHIPVADLKAWEKAVEAPDDDTSKSQWYSGEHAPAEQVGLAGEQTDKSVAEPNGEWMQQPHVAEAVNQNAAEEAEAAEAAKRVLGTESEPVVAGAAADIGPDQKAWVDAKAAEIATRVNATNEQTPEEVETTPNQPEYEQPDLAQVFSSPESLDAMLKNDMVDPQVKNEVRNLTRRWQELEIAVEGNKFWGDVAAPQLSELMQAGGNTVQNAEQVMQDLEKAASVLTQVSDQLEQHGVMGLQNAPSLRQLAPTIEMLRNIGKQMPGMQSFIEKTAAIDTSVMEKDQRLKAAAKNADQIDAGTLKGLSDLLAEKGSLEEARKAIGEKEADQNQVRLWKFRKQATQDAIELAKAAKEQGGSVSINHIVTRFANEADAMLEQAARSQYDIAGMRDMRDRYIRTLVQDFERIKRFSALSQQYAEDAKR